MKQRTCIRFGFGVLLTAGLVACTKGRSHQYQSQNSGCTEGACSQTVESADGTATTTSGSSARVSSGSDSLGSSAVVTDAGVDGSNTASEASTAFDASDAAECPTSSAIALLPEGEADYVVSGDEACAGNQGCTPLEEASIPMGCGNGGYHCDHCNDEVCVSLLYVVECTNPPDEPDAAADSGLSGDASIDGGRHRDAQAEDNDGGDGGRPR